MMMVRDPRVFRGKTREPIDRQSIGGIFWSEVVVGS